MDELARMLEAGREHHRAGRLADAERAYRQVLSRAPNQVDALHLLGMLATQVGHFDAGFELMKRSVELAPQSAAFHLNYGVQLHRAGRLAPAIAELKRAIELGQNSYQVLTELGMALLSSGDFAAAEPVLRRVVQLAPMYAGGHSNLGLWCVGKDRFDEAVTHYRRAIQLDPKAGDLHFNLSYALGRLGHRDESLRELAECLRLNPNFVGAHINLGNMLLETGEVHEAIARYSAALNLKPDFVSAHTNILLAMHYVDDFTPQQIFAEHLAFAQRFTNQIATAPPARETVDRDPNRRLRIGYFSPDFRDHPIASFLSGVLAQHNRSQFEICCYAELATSDDVTAKLQSQADHWRNITGVADDIFLQQIRADRIDILIDLAGHTLGNRLLALAHKPAPIMATWMGYPDTTGIPAFDYRITDVIADPPGEADRLHVEKLIRLPSTLR